MINSITIFNPTDSYNYFASKVPVDLAHLNLIVFHFNAPKFQSSRWTTRTRDLIHRTGKKLNFDCCVGYLVDDKNLSRIFGDKSEPQSLPISITFIGFRLFGDAWTSWVDSFHIDEISFIEFYVQ